MKPLPHEYEIALTGASAGYATLSAPGIPDLTAAPPSEYDGPGDAWSPEHLLLASVGACFLFTLRAIARASRAEFLDVDMRTSGTVSKVDGVVRFTAIVVQATFTLPAGGDREKLQRAIDKAAAHCLVTSSLSLTPHIEATILEQGVPTELRPAGEDRMTCGRPRLPTGAPATA